MFEIYGNILCTSRVPTQTGKMGRHFPANENSENFNQTGKVRENHIKYWKIREFQTYIICYF